MSWSLSSSLGQNTQRLQLEEERFTLAQILEISVPAVSGLVEAPGRRKTVPFMADWKRSQGGAMKRDRTCWQVTSMVTCFFRPVRLLTAVS